MIRKYLLVCGVFAPLVYVGAVILGGLLRLPQQYARGRSFRSLVRGKAAGALATPLLAPGLGD
jgi:hypothetical protein